MTAEVSSVGTGSAGVFISARVFASILHKGSELTVFRMPSFVVYRYSRITLGLGSSSHMLITCCAQRVDGEVYVATDPIL